MLFTHHSASLPGSHFCRIALGVLAMGLAAASFSPALSAADEAVPDRPEKLRFAPLNYEPPNPRDYRVGLKSGPVAYVIPDRELPLVNIVIHVRAGDFLDPEGKEGLSGIAGHLVARGGIASKSAEELEERLAFLAAQLHSSVNEERGQISLNLLSKDLDEGLGLLREVLTAPRFQQDKLDLFRQQLVQGMKQRNDDSSSIEQRELDRLAYGGKFWRNRYETQASVDSITREDLIGYHKRWFHPTNFMVAASGDFDRNAMVGALEKLFSDWPFPGEAAPPAPTNIEFAEPGLYLVNKDVNQGRVGILLPGFMRESPDNFAVAVMNMILGGGGFTSRIMNRVRSDEGLAYSAFSLFRGGVYYPTPFHAGFQSKSPTVAFATSIVLEEMRRIAREPVTAEELQTAKRAFIDNLPRRFTTKSQAADAFLEEEITGRFAREPDFWKTYRSKIDAVTLEDVQRVAQKHLDPKRVAILVVGQKAEILKGHPDHKLDFPGLAGGRVVDVPLRDQMTMKPILSDNDKK
ncbi:MAG: insulinase family protein [Verrucomicrobia bacterium]|nr:insulinase family protein [Verrucomicrobiota bacterium]